MVRVAAPLAFLLAATIAVLLIRSALEEPAKPRADLPRVTQTVRTVTETETAPVIHVVKRGDTLEAIASKYRTTVERLLELNADVDPVALTIGQRIRVG